jgi:Meckel syndrome type 1 protein
VDDWQRHRIEGYGFLRIPQEPGFHQLEVQTWRPRGSLYSEIHSFFLGGSIRILKLEELVRVSHIDENGKDDIVNRFGLETEDGGRIKVQLNVMTQDRLTRQSSR